MWKEIIKLEQSNDKYKKNNNSNVTRPFIVDVQHCQELNDFTLLAY